MAGAAFKPRGRQPVIPRDEQLTAADYAQGKRDCALLIKIYGKTPLLVSWLADMKAGEERCARLDDLDREIDDILKGAA